MEKDRFSSVCPGKRIQLCFLGTFTRFYSLIFLFSISSLVQLSFYTIKLLLGGSCLATIHKSEIVIFFFLFYLYKLSCWNTWRKPFIKFRFLSSIVIHAVRFILWFFNQMIALFPLVINYNII